MQVFSWDSKSFYENCDLLFVGDGSPLIYVHLVASAPVFPLLFLLSRFLLPSPPLSSR